MWPFILQLHVMYKLYNTHQPKETLEEVAAPEKGHRLGLNQVLISPLN